MNELLNETPENELPEWKLKPELVEESIKIVDPSIFKKDGTLKKPIKEIEEDILCLLSIPEFSSVSNAYQDIVHYRRNYNKRRYEDVLKKGVKEDIADYEAFKDYPYGGDDLKDTLLAGRYENYKEYSDLEKEFDAEKLKLIKMMKEKDLGTIFPIMFEIASVYVEKDKIIL